VYTDTSGTFEFNNMTVTGNIILGKYTINSDSSGNLLITDMSSNKIIFKSNENNSFTMNLTNPKILNGTASNILGTNNFLVGGMLTDVSGRYGLTIGPSPWTMPNKNSLLQSGDPVPPPAVKSVNTTGGSLNMWDFNSDGNGTWAATTTNIPNGVYASGSNAYMVVEPWGTQDATRFSGLSLYYSGDPANGALKIGAVIPSVP